VFKKDFKDVGIALGGIAVTILFNFATMGIVDPEKLKELERDHSQLVKFLAVPFDLWIVALSLLLGAYVSMKTADEREKLVAPLFISIGVVLLMLASFGASQIYPDFHPDWLKIYGPDLIGFLFVGFSARRAIVG
jgi:hypothetical protein